PPDDLSVQAAAVRRLRRPRMRAKPGSLIWYVAALALVAVAAADLYRTLQDERSDLTRMYNSDTLFSASLYEDLFVDGFSWEGWSFGTEAYLFPDVLLYFAARAVTGKAAAAVFLFGALQFGLLVAAVLFLLRSARGRCGLVGGLAVLVAAAGYLAFNS